MRVTRGATARLAGFFLAAWVVAFGTVVASPAASHAEESPFSFQHVSVHVDRPTIEISAFAYGTAVTSFEVLGGAPGWEDVVIGSGPGVRGAFGGGHVEASIPVDRDRIGPRFKVRATSTAPGYTTRVVTEQFENLTYEVPVVFPVSVAWTGLSYFPADQPPILLSYFTFPHDAASRVDFLSSCPGRTNEVLASVPGKLRTDRDATAEAFFEGPRLKDIGPDFVFRVSASAPGYTSTVKTFRFAGRGGACGTSKAAPRTQPAGWISSWGARKGVAKVGRTVRVTSAKRSAAGVRAGVKVRYQWQLGGRAIHGATGPRYRIGKTATIVKNGRKIKTQTRNKVLRVKISSTRSGYTTRSAYRSFGKVRR